ncbi:MAG: vWA domain-containing protein [Deinococcales bacterium]
MRFSRELRKAGLSITPSQTEAFGLALLQLDPLDPRAFADAARACLVSRREDLPKFERVFRGFWLELGMGGLPNELLNQATLPNPKQKPSPAEVRDTSNRPKNPNPQTPPQLLTDSALSYSLNETLKKKRFDHMSAAELEAAKAALRHFAWRIGERQTRRYQSSKKGKRLDYRRSFRSALRYGGEWLELRHKIRKSKPRPLVVLADISGSMERYARLLLHFMHAVTHKLERKHIETFAFGTRLTRISKNLERRDVDSALSEVGKNVNDWAGGTRIGQCLETFNRLYAKQVLGRGAVVLLISDGWDQGEPKVLGAAVERLQKTCHRLIWLNPLIGSADFKPQTRGLLAALPFVDDFLSIHNLHSFEQLAQHLEGISSRRSARQSGIR